MIVWLIGLSGAGKTTVGQLLRARLQEDGRTVAFLDGDALREVWGDDLGHSIEERRINAGRISRLCRLLDSQGVWVVACVLSLFPSWQDWNRANFSSYFEVFLDAPMTTLRERDPKGLYRAATEGLRDVAGVDIPFTPPPRPDLTLDASGVLAPEQLADRIHTALARCS